MGLGADRRRWLLVASLAALGWAGLVVTLPAADGRAAAPAQADPGEAYRLVATWDGNTAQGAPGSVLDPAGIDVTDAMVVLVDRGNDRVQRFSPQGAFELAWGRAGATLDALSEPQDVAVDGDRIYVTDRGNARIVTYGLDGRPLEAWTAPGMTDPWGVAARAGRVYVTNRAGREVVVFEQGGVVARWTGLDDPMGLAVGPDGRVYVADRGASEVKILDPRGAAVGTLRTSLAPIDVAVDPASDLYVQSAGAILWYPAGAASSRQALYFAGMQGVALSTRHGLYATVARMDSKDQPSYHGVVRYPWRPQDGLPAATGGGEAQWKLRGFPPGRLERPHAVVAGPSGLIWVADAWPRLQAFDANGHPRDPIVPASTVGIAAVDLAEAPGGEILVGEARRLVRVGPSGTVTQAVRLAAGTNRYWLTALTWRATGLPRVTLLDSALPSARDYGVTRTLQPIGAWPLAPGAPWSLFWDLAVPEPNPTDRLYAVDRGRGEVVVFENGRRTAVWPIEGVPVRAAVDRTGNVYVLSLDGLVHKLSSSGQLLALWDAGAFAAGASAVVDLTVDQQGRVYTVDRETNKVRVWERDPSATPEVPASRGSACRLRGDKVAEPASVVLGNPVTIRLQVGGECPNAAPRADIVLAIDRSGSMNAGNAITDTRSAALVFLGAIDLTRDRVGLVTFNNGARVAQPLTNDRAAVERAVRGITAVGGTNIAEALEVATSELFGPNARADTQPVIVLLTDGRDTEPDDALAAAAHAQGRGARVFTIGFGDVDPMVMVLAATAPEQYYHAPDTSRLTQIYAEIAQRITADVLARSMTVVDRLPANMRYVLDSARPPATWQPDARTLTWQLTDVPFAGTTLTYAVQPSELGQHPTNVEAAADYVDGLQWRGHLRFPVPTVAVVNVAPTATPTSTPFPTPTPAPTATATPPPEPLYLPITVRLKCRDKQVHADVALVMDTSGSMQEAVAEGGPTKLSVAIDAARLFVRLLKLPGDQAAVVSFNSQVTLVQPLTSDLDALLGALAGLQTGQGTRIDLGIDRAAEELVGSRAAPGSNRVMVVLTDGRASGVEDSVVRARADAARQAGIAIYTVGLGTDVDATALGEIASGPGYAFLAPSPDQLEQIYRDIAYTIACPDLAWP